ncbi:hypothetical protein [Streptomyces noursei]|uniref:hypothetical protein n=1 Tax=Streptomyces noursei TaxID=1971 RepID=UPI0016757D79|nr:hypothetical protein [Streptomyces noursei]MCZ1019779.1 hypothetical protein [Streptomyces noursei]GGX36688.1 hypothetical protein GCM10010341_67920 [Streptomyces noursei]
MTVEEPCPVLVQARGGPSPLYEPEDPAAYDDLGAYTRTVPLDDERLALPADLADALRAWSRSRPAGGFTSRPDLRKHVKHGLATTQQLARRLGWSWSVRYWDERQRTAKWLCWGCNRLHWERDERGTPLHPVDVTVEGEYAFGPLRAEGFGDFFPDDPAAALDLSDNLIADLYTWAKSIDTTLNLDLRDREEGKYDAEWERLFQEGMDLAKRVAHELGPARTVTYKGLANGGLAALTSITWQGDRQL